MTKINKQRLLGAFVLFLFCVFFIPPILAPNSQLVSGKLPIKERASHKLSQSKFSEDNSSLVNSSGIKKIESSGVEIPSQKVVISRSKANTTTLDLSTVPQPMKTTPKIQASPALPGLILESTVGLEQAESDSENKKRRKAKHRKQLGIGDFAEQQAAENARQLMLKSGIKSAISRVRKSDGDYFRIEIDYTHQKQRKKIETIAQKSGYEVFLIKTR